MERVLRITVCVHLLLHLTFDPVLGEGSIFIELGSFSNPTGTGFNDHCCDGKWAICQPNGCDHKFTFCLDHTHTRRSRCRLGKQSSSRIRNQNVIHFGAQFGSLRNPLQFPIADTVPDQIRLKVVVFDHDLFFDDFVDFLKEDIDVSANYSEAKIHELVDRTRLSMKVWKECAPNWYGRHCNNFCLITEEERGQYECNPEDGSRVFIQGDADCYQLQKSGVARHPGIYTVRISRDGSSEVFCQDGWSLVQRRVDASTDFERNWTEYRRGFGDLEGNFWMGLERLHLITNTRRHSLRVDIEGSNGTHLHALYEHFSVDGPEDKYTMHVGGYSGNAGDALQYSGMNGWRQHDAMPFSTPDRDNDRWEGGNCAQLYGSGWWFNRCYWANLNGPYLSWEDGVSPYCMDGRCVSWRAADGYRDTSLRASSMWVKPID